MKESELSDLNRGNCPTCSRRGFVIGPQGGISINIECANTSCRARYNVAFYGGYVQAAQRIPKRSDGGLEWPSEPKIAN
jgi:hypothetical protein